MNLEAIRQAQERLAKEIKCLKQTRDEHEKYLSGDETRTRQLLIDPLLEALGWAVRDPAQVHLEYKGTSGTPDYALFSHGKVVVLIEAKKLDIPLARIAPTQVIKYARDQALSSLKYVVWTNGDHWQIWLIEKNSEESFRLSKTPEADCLLKATPLLRMRITLEMEERGASSPAPAQTQLPTSPEDSVPPTPELTNNGDEVPLTKLTIEMGQEPPPVTNIKFPNSSTKSLNGWVDLFVSVAEHLVETGKLSERDCPVRNKRSTRNLVHTEPIHPDGRAFTSKQKIVNGLYVPTNPNSANCHKNACYLLEQFGIDPSTVLVSTNQS